MFVPVVELLVASADTPRRASVSPMRQVDVLMAAATTTTMSSSAPPSDRLEFFDRDATPTEDGKFLRASM
ncbi:unnamed protein product [Heligmosomoides polygyrus]|uniref:Secreted protein n=1 Tax=Heligmosomoides polygyrus TaxID=6339 RepID=A0A183FSF1_HELPZ|nr:unnamed protein product [Heligmosomoides polygyrus]